MDKLKRRAKQKRRREREAAEVAADRELTEAFNEHYKKLGMRHDFKPGEVRRAYMQVEKKSIATAIMADMISTLWIMHRHYGYGNQRLCRLATLIMQRVNWVGDGQRSLDHLDEELRYDAKLDCNSYWDTQTDNVPAGLSAAENQRRHAVLKAAKPVFPLIMHAVFYDLFKQPLSRESMRLKKIAILSSTSARRAIEHNILDEYIKDLGKCGFKIDMHGRFGGKDVKGDDYQKFKRQLTM